MNSPALLPAPSRRRGRRVRPAAAPVPDLDSIGLVPPGQLWTLREVASRLRVSPRRVAAAVRAGDLVAEPATVRRSLRRVTAADAVRVFAPALAPRLFSFFPD